MLARSLGTGQLEAAKDDRQQSNQCVAGNRSN